MVVVVLFLRLSSLSFFVPKFITLRENPRKNLFCRKR
jgi:hypothetical protein